MADPITPRPDMPGGATPSTRDSTNEVRNFSSDAGLGRTGNTPATGRSDDREIVAALNELIETSKDGEKGFALAAKDSKDAALTVLFSEGEQSCRAAAAELQEQVRALGGNPDNDGSMKAAVHRGWLSL